MLAMADNSWPPSTQFCFNGGLLETHRGIHLLPENEREMEFKGQRCKYVCQNEFKSKNNKSQSTWQSKMHKSFSVM
jgi:hypothetical protein